MDAVQCFDWVIAVATVVNVCVASRQWAAMLESNQISQASFVASQRPYMYFAGVNIRNIKMSDGTYNFVIAPTFGNSGSTPTIDLRSRAACWTKVQPEAEPFISEV